MKLRQNLYRHVIPKNEEYVNAVPLFKSDDNRGKGKLALNPSPLNAEQDAPNKWKRTDSRSNVNSSGTFRSTAHARESTQTRRNDRHDRDPSLENHRDGISGTNHPTFADALGHHAKGRNSSHERPDSSRKSSNDRSNDRNVSLRRYRSPRRRSHSTSRKRQRETRATALSSPRLTTSKNRRSIIYPCRQPDTPVSGFRRNDLLLRRTEQKRKTEVI
jgi:hypothetical protein